MCDEPIVAPHQGSTMATAEAAPATPAFSSSINRSRSVVLKRSM